MEPLPSNHRIDAEARARLAAIVESSDDAIVSKTLDGIVTTWNHGAERIFGYTPDEMIGKPITTIIPPDRHDEEPQILARIQAGERVEHYETVRRRKDGRLIDVSVTISPIRDDAGRVIGASKIARDITAYKQAQRDLQAAKDAAEAANRAKDRFLSVLSHELRTPLTPALAALSFIESHPELTAEEVREQIGMIRRNVETEARLVDDLLDVTRIARGKLVLHFEVVDAHAVVRDAVAVLQGEIDAKGLAVTLALRAKDHHVWADPGRLQQVLLNLLGNAIKFTPNSGDVVVRSSDAAGGGMLQLEVADTGVGIEPSALPRLFDAFEQGEQNVTRRFGGLGLGLSIARTLVEMHHGSIAAASDGKDRGSTFTVRLATVQPVARPPATPAGARSVLKGCRVLLVEDHADTRLVMAKLLGSFGCIVTQTGTVQEAIAQADRNEFDLLVSDIGLPDGSGTDVMRHVRERHRVKGIALSGFGQDDDIRRSREAGFEAHLVKPVNFEQLKNEIRRVTLAGGAA
jgi:PAS domain S-box-containing protein